MRFLRFRLKSLSSKGDFEEKFRRLFGREMTPEERKFYSLTEEVAEQEDAVADSDDGSAA